MYLEKLKPRSFTHLILMAAGSLLFAAPLAQAGTVKGAVTDGSKQPVAAAAVYLIPAADVAKLGAPGPAKLNRKINSPNDEPMEDNLAANRDKYLKGTTNAKGSFSIPKVNGGKYFVYVEPSNKEYLPGGTLANKAMTAAELSKAPLKIAVSGKIADGATFVGSSFCLGCHSDKSDMKKTLHKLGIAVVDKPSKLQDFSRFPNFNDGLKKLQAGTTLYFSAFDKTRGFDKFQISEKAPADAATLNFSATFFKDTDGKLKFRTKNAKDAADPERTYTVEMTYGGGVYKQRYLYRSGDHLFPFVQYNTLGKDEFKDRGRKPFRDYHGDWLFNAETNKLIDPPKNKSFEKECASCHYNGYTLTPTVGGDFVGGAVNDPNGEADIDGDGAPNELNLGCEGCHGPGSDHIKSPMNRKAATIVNPAKLASERATVICNQCHSRPQGNLKNDQPVNKDNRMLIPGTSRNDYLVNYTTREDAAQKDFWDDGIHSKSHHQQGTDLVRSKHYMNGNQTLSCYNCHDAHGKSGIKHQLKMEARDEKNTLCASCHKDVNMKAHTKAKVGEAHEPDTQIRCISCHMPKTMQTGSGLGKGIAAEGANYWMNDISSHLFDVPRKAAIKGVEPGKAMPIPYTNACGACHDAKSIK